MQVDATCLGDTLLDGRLTLAKDVAEYATGIERVRVGYRLLWRIQHWRRAVIASQRLVQRGPSVGRRSVAREPGDQQWERHRHGFRRRAFIGAELLTDLLECVAA